MKIVDGKFGEAIVYTDLVDDNSIAQVKELLDQPFVEGQKVRMMPDIHAGKGCVVGTTMTVTDKICPNLIGVDIGCGMLAVKIDAKIVDFDLLDTVIRKYIPYGTNVHPTDNLYYNKYSYETCSLNLTGLHCMSHVDLDRARRSIGTLGGGNHFIELDEDESGNIWLVIHSGSRHLGVEVAKYYQNQAIKSLHKLSKEVVNSIVKKMKEEGRYEEIQSVIESMKTDTEKVPDELCWCEGELFNDYVYDMATVQNFASINRVIMAKIICEKMGWKVNWEDTDGMYKNGLEINDVIETIHNYLDTENMIMRKGSVAAYNGLRLIIPMNMRDGSLICIGKGNPDWNYSAPHGAGRVMSRMQAKKQLDLTDYKDTMKNVWSTSVNMETIDEAPMAYKPMESIIENIKDTVDIVSVIKPIYNFKAN